jgi:hypothetical protein
MGSEVFKEGGDVVRIRDGESSVETVVGYGKTKKRRGYGMSFYMVKGRKTGDKESKVGGVVVLDAEVVHHQDKGNRARGVAEKTGGKGLVEVERLKERDEAEIGELTCLFEAVHRFLYTENDVLLSRFILLDEGEERKARQDFGEKRLV